MKVELSKAEKEDIKAIISDYIGNSRSITRVMWSSLDTDQFDKIGYFVIEFYCTGDAKWIKGTTTMKICWNGEREDGKKGLDWIYRR